MGILGRLAGGGVPYISPKEAKEALEMDKSIVLLDVREEEEYRVAHISGAVLVPLSELGKKIEAVIPDKKTKMYVYCMSGGRSASACKVLHQMGYTQVYNLGGIAAWPYEIERL